MDARHYLALYQRFHDNDFKVLTLTTLSTPHNGTALADLLETRRKTALFSLGSRFPTLIDIVASLVGTDAGTMDLQTTHASIFNGLNVPRLPNQTIYHTVAADADQNNNSQIDFVPDEYAEVRAADPWLTGIHQETLSLSRRLVNIPYKFLRTTTSMSFVEFWSDDLTTVSFVAVEPAATPQLNDLLVTIPSGMGVGRFEDLVSEHKEYQWFPGIPDGRNHASICNSFVGLDVDPWITRAEQQIGDLQ